MKKLLMTAVAVSAIATTPAVAATTANYELTGTVAAACSITGSATLDFGSLATGATNAAVSTQSNVDTAAYCNQAATTVTVTKSDLTTSPGAAVPAGFTNTVAITPKIETQDKTLNGVQSAGTLIGAFNSFKVSATTTAPSANLVAGDYTGSITITLSPAS